MNVYSGKCRRFRKKKKQTQGKNKCIFIHLSVIEKKLNFITAIKHLDFLVNKYQVSQAQQINHNKPHIIILTKFEKLRSNVINRFCEVIQKYKEHNFDGILKSLQSFLLTQQL